MKKVTSSLKIVKDEFGNDIREYEIGDKFIYSGLVIEVVELDEDIADVKVKSYGKEFWMKESTLDRLELHS